MRSITIQTAAILLVLAALPGGNVAGEEDDDDHAYIGSDGSPMPTADHAQVCVATAIGGYLLGHPQKGGVGLLGDLPPCNKVTHTNSGATFLGFPVGAQTVTGTTVAQIQSANGNVEFACAWDSGALLGCQVRSAQWPGPGMAFDGACWSEFPSSGDWECRIHS